MSIPPSFRGPSHSSNAGGGESKLAGGRLFSGGYGRVAHTFTQRLKIGQGLQVTSPLFVDGSSETGLGGMPPTQV